MQLKAKLTVCIHLYSCTCHSAFKQRQLLKWERVKDNQALTRQEINHSRMKQAIIHSGIAEEYVNWIQCLSCDIWEHEKCARGTFSDRCKACHSKLTYSALEKRSSKPDQYLERSALSYVRAYGVKLQRIIAIFGVDNLLHLMASPVVSPVLSVSPPPCTV